MSTPVEHLSAALADRYRIERELGAGGMATVYLAHDIRHDRDVAIKVLHEDLGAALGPQRFLAEIKTTAKLQHPHILPLLDSGESGGLLFYVMPFVTGETLRQRLARDTLLPIGEVVRIAREVADALGAAHAQGVVHRDVKPENILLQGGHALVADFGIALAVQHAGGQRMTQTGLSLGTPQYMSPEQAAGEQTVDHRADIYALGAVTYEMLTGDPPFTGSSVQAIVAKVLSAEPERPTLLRKTIPSSIESAVLTALAKLPADRFESANAFANALANSSFTSPPASAIPSGTRPRDWRQRLAVPLLMVTVLSATAAVWGWLRPKAETGSGRQLVISVPRLSRMDSPVLSPAGDQIVFIGDGRLWIRLLGDRESRPLLGTDEARAPFWSPDGRQVGYFVGSRVFRIPASGGAPTPVTSIDFACPLDNVCGGSWTDDGRIVLSSGFRELLVVPERGGPAKPYLMPLPGEHFHSVAALPKGRGVVFEVDPDHGPDRIDVWDGRTRRTLVTPASFPRYADPGYLLFTRRDAVWAVRLAGASLSGDPFPVVDHATYPSASRDGALLFNSIGSYEEQLVWVDRNGAMREAVVGDDAAVSNPALSPDETRIAYTGSAGIRIQAPARGVRMALGGSDSIQDGPAWSSTGDRIFYVSTRPGGTDQEDDLIRAMSPGAAPVTVVDSGFDPAVSADGRYFTYTTGNVNDEDLWYRDLRAPASAAKPFLNSHEFSGSLRLSPDDRFAAFVAGNWTSGEFEVYLSRFPGGSDRTQVSTGGVRYGSRVYWSPTGGQLYYVRASDGALMATDVSAGGAQIRLSTPRVLFMESTADLSLGLGLAVSRDSSRFLVVRRTVRHGGEPTAFVLLDHWGPGARE